MSSYFSTKVLVEKLPLTMPESEIAQRFSIVGNI
jgi:hypothetical protein